MKMQMQAAHLLDLPLGKIQSQLVFYIQQENLLLQLVQSLYQSSHKNYHMSNNTNTNVNNPQLQKQSQYQHKVILIINLYFRKYYRQLNNQNKAKRFHQFKSLIIQNNKIPYQLIQKLQPSFQVVIQELGTFYLSTLQQFWFQIPFHQKIVILQTTLDFQEGIIEQNQVIKLLHKKLFDVLDTINQFFTKDIFINQTTFLQNYKFTQACLRTNQKCLKFLSNRIIYDKCKQILTQISWTLVQNEIFKTIFQFELDIHQNGNVLGLKFSQKPTLIFFSNNSEINKKVNILKSLAFDIQTQIITFLHHPNFDQQVYNGFISTWKIRQIIPLIVQVFTKMQISGIHINNQLLYLNNIKNHPNYSYVISSLINYLNKSCRYSSCFQYLRENHMKIFLEIIFPLLDMEKSQIDDFKWNEDEFIEASNCLILPDSYITMSQYTPKKAAAKLLQQLVLRVDESGLSIFMTCIQTLQFLSGINLQSPEKQKFKQTIQTYKIKITRQKVFLIFSILSDRVFREQQQIVIIRQFLKYSNLKQWSELDKYRLFVFANSYFEQLFPNPEDRQVILDEMGRQTKSKTLQKQILTFFLDNIDKLGKKGQQIWFCINNNIQKTNNVQLFKTIDQIISRYSCFQLNKDIIKDILTKTINRILTELKLFQKNNNTQILVECFYILINIAKSKNKLSYNERGNANEQEQNQYYLKLQPQFIDIIQKFVIKSISQIQKANMEEQYLLLIYRLFQVINRVELQHFVFLNLLKNIEFSYNLYRVLQFFIEKDQLLNQQCNNIYLDSLTLIIFNLFQKSIKKQNKSCQQVQASLNLVYILIFKYNILLYIQFHKNLAHLIKKELQIMKEKNSDYEIFCKAALINCFILGQFFYCNIYENGMDYILKNQDITTFKEYQAKLLINTFNFIIYKQGEKMPIDFISSIFKISIRLLHYQRHLLKNQKQQKILQKREQFRFKSKQINKIDVFRQGKILIETIKTKINRDDYQKVLYEAEEQIGKNDLRELISAFEINGSYRKSFAIIRKFPSQI